MNLRSTLIVVSSIACAATVAGVVMQGRQLGDLRAEHQRLLVLQETPQDSTGPVVVVPGSASSDGTPSLELLRLRNEVNQLTKHRRELENVAKENERLQVQVAITRTNKSAATALAVPPGYLHKSNARNLGYSSPEATFETLLWAVENRDLDTLMRAFSPKMAEEFRKHMEGKSLDEIFKEGKTMPPMRIKSRQVMQDGIIQLEMEMDGSDRTEKMNFRPINGEWKMEEPNRG